MREVYLTKYKRKSPEEAVNQKSKKREPRPHLENIPENMPCRKCCTVENAENHTDESHEIFVESIKLYGDVSADLTTEKSTANVHQA